MPPGALAPSSGHVWSLDVWLYGCLVYEVFNGAFSKIEQVKSRGQIPEGLFGCGRTRVGARVGPASCIRRTDLTTLAAPPRYWPASCHRRGRSAYKDMLRGDPKQRPAPSQFLERGLAKGGYFVNDLVQAGLFLETFALKDSHEKDAFFRKLTESVDVLPLPFVKHRVLPELLQALEFGNGSASLAHPSRSGFAGENKWAHCSERDGWAIRRYSRRARPRAAHQGWGQAFSGRVRGQGQFSGAAR